MKTHSFSLSNSHSLTSFKIGENGVIRQWTSSAFFWRSKIPVQVCWYECKLYAVRDCMDQCWRACHYPTPITLRIVMVINGGRCFCRYYCATAIASVQYYVARHPTDFFGHAPAPHLKIPVFAESFAQFALSWSKYGFRAACTANFHRRLQTMLTTIVCRCAPISLINRRCCCSVGDSIYLAVKYSGRIRCVRVRQRWTFT